MFQTDIDIGPTSLRLKSGDLVELRSAEETLTALDERGELENVLINARNAGVLWPAANGKKGRSQDLRHGQRLGYATDERRCAPDEIPVRRLGSCWMPDYVLPFLEGAMAGAQLAAVARCIRVRTASWQAAARAGAQLAAVASCIRVRTASWQAAARAGTASALHRRPSCPWPTLIRHFSKPIPAARAGGAACCHNEGADASRCTYSDTTWRGHRDDNCG
jgi:hypothetical protein